MGITGRWWEQNGSAGHCFFAFARKVKNEIASEGRSKILFLPNPARFGKNIPAEVPSLYEGKCRLLYLCHKVTINQLGSLEIARSGDVVTGVSKTSRF